MFAHVFPQINRPQFSGKMCAHRDTSRAASEAVRLFCSKMDLNVINVRKWMSVLYLCSSVFERDFVHCEPVRSACNEREMSYQQPTHATVGYHLCLIFLLSGTVLTRKGVLAHL